MNKFNDFNIPEGLKGRLTGMNYITPTPIQEQAIPVILEGRDVLGSAQTGTGKTGAFIIPIIANLMGDEDGSAIILTPTRELARQIYGIAIQMLDKNSGINAALLIGGESMHGQLQQLRRKARLIVGTPGRVNDHLDRKSLNLSQTRFLVLDETDRMLDMGFGIQIDEVVSYIPKERQTLLFSATLPKAITKLSDKYLSNPVRISSGDVNTVAKNIVQNEIHTKDKYPELLKALEASEGSVLIFVKTQRGAEEIKDKLIRHDHSADVIHGGLRQSRRDRVIKAFRSQKYRIMVATDVAARGLDIPHISFVINYDIPQCPEDYIHRIGRTARGEDSSGEALSLISPADKGKWVCVQRFLKGDEDDMPQNGYSRGGSRSGGRGRSFGGGSGGGGGGGTPPSNPPVVPDETTPDETVPDETTPADTTPADTTPADTTPAEVSQTPGEPAVDANGQVTLGQMTDDATTIASGDVTQVMAKMGATRDTALEAQYSEDIVSKVVAGVEGLTAEMRNVINNFVTYGTKSTDILGAGERAGVEGLTAEMRNVINNFVTYGTKSTDILGAGERAGVVNSYKEAFDKLPSTIEEWNDVVKIANGRWPNERSTAKEDRAKLSFKTIYLRDADMNQPNDNAAVTVMAYGLRPANRNLNSEKVAITTFRYVFGYSPQTASAWDAVRAIAYSGSTR